MAYGDALGAPFEFWNASKIQEHFAHNKLELLPFIRGNQEFPAGFTTDDTSQMICLAESLLENGFDLEDQFDRYRRWLSEGYASAGGVAYGIGQHTVKVLFAGKKKALSMLDGSDHKAGGNGALMRTAPLALYFDGISQSDELVKELQEKTILSTYVTHNSFVNGQTCAIFNTILSLIITGVEKQDVLERARLLLGDLPTELQEIVDLDYSKVTGDQLQISGYAPATLRIALWGFFNHEDYLSSIRAVIELGRDTDTFAAITGALAGAYYGYEQIAEQVEGRLVLHDRVENISMELCKRSQS